jgi:hypothetical protein
MCFLPPVGAACAMLLCVAGITWAAGPPPNWPPDPSRYDKPGTEIAPGLKVGDELNASNAAAAKDLLPPEVLAHYEKGEYVNPIDSWPNGINKWDDSFEASTKANAGKYAIDPETGKPPEYVYGHPFPTIAPDDPQAGIKLPFDRRVHHNVSQVFDIQTLSRFGK